MQDFGRMKEEHTLSRKLNKIQLLTLLRPRNMRWDKRIHKRLEIRPPPLRQRIPNLPLLIHALPTKLRAHRRQSFIQPFFEPRDLFVFRLEVVAGEFEERVGDLQHEDVGVVVFVADEDAFASAPHAVLGVVFFEALEAREDGGIFFWLGLFGAECVVGEGVEADGFGLVAVEGIGENRRVGGL